MKEAGHRTKEEKKKTEWVRKKKKKKREEKVKMKIGERKPMIINELCAETRKASNKQPGKKKRQ